MKHTCARCDEDANAKANGATILHCEELGKGIQWNPLSPDHPLVVPDLVLIAKMLRHYAGVAREGDRFWWGAPDAGYPIWKVDNEAAKCELRVALDKQRLVWRNENEDNDHD